MNFKRKLIPLIITIFLTLSKYSLEDGEKISIQGIEPNGGLTSGETRVLVRLKNFNSDLISTYPHPSCRFGSDKYTVPGTYAKCSPRPRKPGERQPSTIEKTEICIQCEDSPKHSDDIVPFTVSLLGDFTDTLNSIPYRYYNEPKIIYISPRTGPKDGNTKVDVYGEGFLNFDQNLRCGFGSKEVQGIFINSNHIQCISPFSSIVQRKIPFSISLNNQQNTQDDIPYVYYENPTIYRIEPNNRGPDSGGTVIHLRGANFNPFKELQDLKLENDTFCLFETLGKRPAKIHSSTEIECITPPSYEKLEVPVEITLNNQQYTDDNVPFYYYHPPYTYYISPKIGPVSGGTIVKVMGGNFEDTGVVKCKFGDKLGKGKFISKNELQCESPEVEKPCVVPLRVATRDEEYSSGLNTQYTYYDTPIIHFIEPACGPATGYTQITVYGENFPVGYSNNVKCLFNGEIQTDVTIMNYNELKCDSPPLPTKPGSEEYSILEYNLTILVNEDDESGPAQTFYYYKSPIISSISPIMGGVEGDTTVKISGSGFDQPGACNITARFATYHARPILVEDNFMIVKSPEANYTGSVVVQVSLNGQQFGDDITYNYRDQQNTFYYYKCPIVSGIHPDEGPSAGGNDISIYGIGFLEPFFALDKENNLKASLYNGNFEKEIFYRFIDFEDDGIIYGETQSISLEDATTQKIVLKSPSILESPNHRGRNNIKTIIQLSYDGENFCDYENIFYTFFNLPNIIDINPKYAPLEAKDQKIEIKLDNLNCNGKDDCSKGIKCRFAATKENSNKVFIMEGKFVENNKIECDAPNVNIPEEFNIEASINGGEDYTNNNYNYTYYDPFVLKVEPQMLSDKGNTKMKITGYGFANTGKSMKIMFGDSDEETLKCGEKQCLLEAEYVDSTILNTISKPRNEVIDKETGHPIEHYKKFPVEVAIYNDDFTNNKVSVFYYEDPTIISDIDSDSAESLHLTPYSKAVLRESLVDSIPCNLDTFIPIPVDGSEIERHLDEINDYAKYTCLFEANGKKKITDGVFTKFPLNNTVHNLFLCQSPRFVNEVTDKAKIRISLNGYDFSDDYYQLELTDPVNIYKIVPSCGPIEGGTNVKIYGTGFQNSEKAVFKWGPQNLVPMNKKSFLEKTNEQTSQEVLYDMQKIIALNNPEDLKRDELLESLEDVEIQKIIVTAPHAPNDNIQLKTRGGLDYISISKTNLLPLDDFLKEYYANNFIHTNFEYYYYRQIYIEGFYPSGSISTGGAKVMVIGAWFQYKPEYGLRPFCKFGDEVVEGEYLSNVRISCIAPPSEKEFNRVPFYVSLNGEDWLEAEKPFRYYGDFKNAEFDLIEPDSGPTTGGTHVKIYGKGFTAIFDENELLCQFEPVDTIEEIDENGKKVIKEIKSKMEPINAPARLSSPSRERKQPNEDENEEENENHEIDEEGAYIECQTPSGWPKGSKTNVKIAFDGQTFLDTKQNFYFFQIDEIFPSAGPNTGEGNIEFLGGGFEHDGNITLVMNRASYKPINATEKELEFDIPNMPKDYTGYVDMEVYLNGVDEIEFKEGFYYYKQPTIDSIYPKTGPSTGNTTFHVFGKDFRDDFRGADIKCKVGSCIGEGEVISDKEMKCNFDNLPVEEIEFTEKEDGTKVKSGNPIQIALNGVAFTKKDPKLSITTYSIQEISPVSGPIESGTTIVVKGSGFIKSENIRCRFGVPGYFAYTEGTFIDYNKITCPSPKIFEIPNGGGLPFTVPFSIAFNDDEFDPWTRTSHVFTFYKTPDVAIITPKEFNTTSIVPVYLKADVEEQEFFSMPLASIKEEEYQLLNKEGEHIRQVKKSVKDQPIMCRFGKYGVTQAEFLNETELTCLTPKFEDEDNEIIYEEIKVEVAPNGIDYIDAGKANLKGQEAKSVGCMYCILAILGVLFLAALGALIAWMCSKKMLGIDGEIPKEPHTENRQLKYIKKDELVSNEQSH